MRIGLNPNRAANPLLWIITLAFLLAIGSGIVRSLTPPGDRPNPAQPASTVETPKTLMNVGYLRFKATGNAVHRDLVGALARNYLDEANRQKEPLVWIRTEYNNTLAELKEWQNSKLEYARDEAEKLASLQINAAALALLMNAIAQDKTGNLDKSINLQALTQEGETFFSLYDGQVIERRYPHE
jgi:hypothetical protein